MNYYEHHLGDFARDAGHLSMVKEGAYRRLIDIYYARQRPLPAELGALFELSKCKTRHEKGAVEAILTEFFVLQDDGWHQKRCDEEIARFKRKSEKAAESANMRWHSDGNANALRTQSEGNARRRNALQSPISNHQKPISNSHPPSASASGGKRGVGTFKKVGPETLRGNGLARIPDRYCLTTEELEQRERDQLEREEAARAVD